MPIRFVKYRAIIISSQCINSKPQKYPEALIFSGRSNVFTIRTKRFLKIILYLEGDVNGGWHYNEIK